MHQPKSKRATSLGSTDSEKRLRGEDHNWKGQSDSILRQPELHQSHQPLAILNFIASKKRATALKLPSVVSTWISALPQYFPAALFKRVDIGFVTDGGMERDSYSGADRKASKPPSEPPKEASLSLALTSPESSVLLPLPTCLTYGVLLKHEGSTVGIAAFVFSAEAHLVKSTDFDTYICASFTKAVANACSKGTTVKLTSPIAMASMSRLPDTDDISETPVDLTTLQHVSPRLAMAIAFEEESHCGSVETKRLLVDLKEKPDPRDENPPGPSGLPGEWHYLWGNVWSVDVPTYAEARKIIVDSRVESVTLE